MAMQVLEAGGIPILTDKLRKADSNNLKGYYEYEPVKQMMQGNIQWLAKAEGKAVKIVSPLLFYLPKDYTYRIIFMQRDLGEVLRSQNKMLELQNKKSTPTNDEAMRLFYENHLQKVTTWLEAQNNIQTLYLGYRDVVDRPDPAVGLINQFLGGKLNAKKMAIAVNPALYSQRT